MALTQIVGMRGILVLAYVSGLMFVMRHFAGPLVKRLGNIGLLIFSSVFATVGLIALGWRRQSGHACSLAATVLGLWRLPISGPPCWRRWPSAIRAAAPWCSA